MLRPCLSVCLRVCALGVDHSVSILQDQLGTVARLQSELVVRSIDSNFKALVAACAAQERCVTGGKRQTHSQPRDCSIRPAWRGSSSDYPLTASQAADGRAGRQAG